MHQNLFHLQKPINIHINIFVVSKPKPTPNASSTAAHPALQMHPLAAGRKYLLLLKFYP